MSSDHDIRDGDRIVKAADDAPYPHAPSCAGCLRLCVCHGCGFPTAIDGRCTSGGCRRCCKALHHHPDGSHERPYRTIEGAQRARGVSEVPYVIRMEGEDE